MDADDPYKNQHMKVNSVNTYKEIKNLSVSSLQEGTGIYPNPRTDIHPTLMEENNLSQVPINAVSAVDAVELRMQ